jgi:hypothetical protein
MKYTLTFRITRCPLQRIMAAKLIRLTHKIAIQLHLVAEICTICSSRTRRPVRKLLDTLSYSSGNTLDRQQRSGYNSLITNINPEDGGSTASETLVFNHQATRCSNPKRTSLIFLHRETLNYAFV